jgi:hypothetical protein
MKRICFVSIVLLTVAISHTALAQFSIGVKTGVNLAKIEDASTDPIFEELKMKVGLNAALIFNLRFGDSPFGIQLEPGYSQRGGLYKSDETTTSGSISYRVKAKQSLLFNYIEIPLLMRFTPKIGPLEGIVTLGPEFRFIAGDIKVKYAAKNYADGDLVSKTTEVMKLEEGDLNDVLKEAKQDLGIAGGLGLALPLDRITISAEGRYHYGFPFINSSSTDFGSSTTYKEISNRGISISFGIAYRLGE